jgi:hypothetical protein
MRLFSACEKIIENNIDGQKWPFYIESIETTNWRAK